MSKVRLFPWKQWVDDWFDTSVDEPLEDFKGYAQQRYGTVALGVPQWLFWLRNRIATFCALLQIFGILGWRMQEVRKSQNQDLIADPAWSINFGKMESNHGDFPGFRRLRAAASSFGLKGSEILWPSGVGIFHRPDSSLLTSLVDSRSPVLCAMFFTTCKVMEFAEMGYWREKRPELLVSLLMVLHALQLECEKLMELTASSHRFCFLCSRRDSRDGFNNVSSWGWGSGEERSRTLCLSMAHSSSDGHFGYIVCPRIVGSRKNPGMPSQYLMRPEVAICQRFLLWKGKSASNQPCESFNASRDRCGRNLESWWHYEGEPMLRSRKLSLVRWTSRWKCIYCLASILLMAVTQVSI